MECLYCREEVNLVYMVCEPCEDKVRTCIKALAGYKASIIGPLWFGCFFCKESAFRGEMVVHLPNCPTEIARQLEAEWEKKP